APHSNPAREAPAPEAAPRARVEEKPRKAAAPPKLPKAAAPPPAAAGADYILPPLDLLDAPKVRGPQKIAADTEANIAILENTLAQFRIEAQVGEIADGPTVARDKIRLGA